MSLDLIDDKSTLVKVNQQQAKLLKTVLTQTVLCHLWRYQQGHNELTTSGSERGNV